MKKINGRKELGTSFGDNLGWLILYLVINSICTLPMAIGSGLKKAVETSHKTIEGIDSVIYFFDANGIVISFVLMLIVLIIVIKKKKDGLSLDVKKFNSNKKKNILLTIAGFLFMFGLAFLLSDVIRPHLFTSATTENQAGLTSMISEATPIYSLIMFLLLIAIIIPIFEEIFFRYNFKKSFESTIVFIIITSLIFGLIHMPSWSLTFECFYDYFIYVFMGACLAFTYRKTDSICSSMIVHVLNNLISVFMMILPFLK